LKVHSALGPGLLESAYEACLLHELKKGALSVASQVPMPILYDSVKLDVGYRLDLVVEDTIIMEICLPWTNGPTTPMAARRPSKPIFLFPAL
jgi:GxxExxY protein